MTIKWKVAEQPTGRYRSFVHRDWPSASYKGDKIAAQIYCEDAYYPANAKSSAHAPLSVSIADYRETPWKWRKMTATFPTLAEAKAAVDALLTKYPEIMPKDEQ